MRNWNNLGVITDNMLVCPASLVQTTSDFSPGALQHFHWAEPEKWAYHNTPASPCYGTYIPSWDKGATNWSFHLCIIKLWQQKNCLLLAREVRPIKKNGERKENELQVIFVMPSCRFQRVLLSFLECPWTWHRFSRVPHFPWQLEAGYLSQCSVGGHWPDVKLQICC